MDWSLLIAFLGVVVGGMGWATSARKSRVENLVSIIDAQAQRIKDLEMELRNAMKRIDDLEAENRHYLRILACEGIDPNTYADVDA